MLKTSGHSWKCSLPVLPNQPNVCTGTLGSVSCCVSGTLSWLRTKVVPDIGFFTTCGPISEETSLFPYKQCTQNPEGSSPFPSTKTTSRISHHADHSINQSINQCPLDDLGQCDTLGISDQFSPFNVICPSLVEQNCPDSHWCWSRTIGPVIRD